MTVATRPQGETIVSPHDPELGGHRAVRMVGMMVIVRVVEMLVAKG